MRRRCWSANCSAAQLPPASRARESRSLKSLVLVDTFGLRPFDPAPEFGRAMSQFLAEPTGETHTDLWQHCAFDLDALRQRMDKRWQLFEAYNLDRARDPGSRGRGCQPDGTVRDAGDFER